MEQDKGLSASAAWRPARWHKRPWRILNGPSDPRHGPPIEPTASIIIKSLTLPSPVLSFGSHPAPLPISTEGPVIFSGCACEGTRRCMVGLSLNVARELGLHSYFSGYPCSQGHVAFRRLSDKECLECHRVRRRRCNGRYRKRYPEKTRAYAKRWVAENKEKVNAGARRYRDGLSPEEKRRQRLAWRARHPTAYRAQKVRKRARRRKAAGTHTGLDIKLIHEAQRGRCAYFRVCRTKLGDDYHVDHIVPIALGGTNDRTNIQLCCPACNMTKQAAHPVDFAQRIGLLI